MTESAERWAANDPPDYLLKPPLYDLWRASEQVGLRYEHERTERKLVVGAYGAFSDDECERTPNLVARSMRLILVRFLLEHDDHAAPVEVAIVPVVPVVRSPMPREVFERENSWPEVQCRYRYGYDR